MPLLTPCAFYDNMSPQNSNCYKRLGWGFANQCKFCKLCGWMFGLLQCFIAHFELVGQLSWRVKAKVADVFWRFSNLVCSCTILWPSIKQHFILLLCAYRPVPTVPMQHKGTSMFRFALIVVKSNWEVSLSSSRHCSVPKAMPFALWVEQSNGAIDNTDPPVGYHCLNNLVHILINVSFIQDVLASWQQCWVLFSVHWLGSILNSLTSSGMYCSKCVLWALLRRMV